MKKTLTLSLLFCLVLITSITAQTKKTQKETFQATYNASKALVKSNDFQFVGDYVFNNKKREKLEADFNTLKIDEKKITGQLTSLSTYNLSILKINEAIDNYSTSFNDEKQTISISIKAKDYQISIDIKPNGNAFLTIVDGLSKNITQVGKISKV